MTRRIAKVRAPELNGRGWLNTGGETLRIADFRGSFLLLDFWTFCCINCLHVLDELRPVEQKWADELVVVGVHSPKFVHEADPVALAAAVERYAVHHPVLDDPELETWQAYTARAWPTLVLVDPEGYVVAQYAGEGHAHAVDALIGELVEEHRAKGTLQPGDSPYVPPTVEPSDLRFPASAMRLDADRLVVADAGHNEVVVLGAPGAERDGEVLQRIGGFNEPNGVAVVPEHLREQLGYDLVVADTVGHRIAAVTLADGKVRTLAGDGQQWMAGDGVTRLSSPWDVVFWRDLVWIAMAGTHTIWTFDPFTGVVEATCGTTNEGLLDGPVAEAWFAQPSRLAVDTERDRLWIADSETSAIRYLHDVDGELHVSTEVGTGLFDFGLRDGDVAQALFQHPLGVAVLADGSIAVADTYNGAVRRIHDGVVSTLATGLMEPSGLLADDADPTTLLVVESTGHRITALPLGGVVEVDGFAHRTQRPVTEVAAGVELVIDFTPPPGQKVDDRFGPPTQLLVTSTPDALIREGEGRGTDLTRRIVLDPTVGEGVLHVAARAGSCDIEAGEGAACHMHQQDWGVPVRVVVGADAELRLPLGGTA
ncbi:NHL domain-containing thioredoxin family protein [Nocardioides yefusunii]|uniref:NHL domain-containing thioredoxin family protein n=1 Tax=Nocardioides yefusunii TaxID=2500546 RepID=A0ABW1QU81_9ACTN|nr:NHL domain-containing thioredoxin family protein [Nocardioides yefusunii]